MKNKPKPKADDASLYFTDNGRIVCGAHLGMSARFTGRDISGQPIKRVTDRDARAWPPDLGTIKCEDCGRNHTSEDA